MIYLNNKEKIYTTNLNEPLFFPTNINEIIIEGNIILGHFKVNNEVIMLNDPKEIYSKIETWEENTLLNAFFNKDLEAGNIKGQGENIDKIIIKRLSPRTNYKKYETIGELPYSENTKSLIFKDIFINSNEVYLYTIQPVTKNNHYGALQNTQPGLNLYDRTWLINQNGEQLEVLNSSINSINIITKDGITETIGNSKPYVSRFSNLNYKTFQISGTIASIGDFSQKIAPLVEKDLYTDDKNIQEIIKRKFLEKTGNLPEKYNNSIRNDNNFERLFKEKVLNFLNDGTPKIFKSPTEGLLLVKITNISLSPKSLTNRIICDFTATITEIGEINSNTIKSFMKRGND